MGIDTVLAYSWEDRDSMAVSFSTEAVCIGPAPAARSYLNQDALIAAAKAYHCEAVHPGYGFLSENADFAEACEKNGLVWIGPAADMIRQMGDKQSARSLMKKNGVPVVPGSDGLVADPKEAALVAEKVGYPVLLKATAGGGGRGMRVAQDADELEDAFREASSEAESAFGDGSLYLEKLIVNPRHIEVQIMGDSQGHICTLGERDCSMQRRNQKLIEESPARCLNQRQRTALYKAALRAAKAAHYVSAGTVEFVLDHSGQFYFIEMNTRIQVEHSVTEMVTGRLQGHAIECRINAENPEKNFAPCPGTISFLHMPAGFGVRVENALFPGCRVSPYYDSMIAKLIVHAPGRLAAIRKMRVALEEMTVEGIDTNINFLYLLMFNRDYMMGNFDTSFLARDTGTLVRWDEESRKKFGRKAERKDRA